MSTLSNIGRVLGNWNDRMYGQRDLHSHRWVWRNLNRIASWLYVKGDSR